MLFDQFPEYIKIDEKKSQKTEYQTFVSASLRFQKEPLLGDSFWVVGVQTNYFIKRIF
jgi:hypothetical protein